MAITNIIKPKGANGTSGASPTNGTDGTDAIFTQNGKIGADEMTVNATGGEGGDGGNNSGAAPGANGGKGGNASITLNGNIFNAPATTSLVVSLNATGGNGGLGGTGTPAGTQGKGGNATVVANGNIIQPNKVMTNIELDAIAIGGNGSTKGNATATLNGNIVQPSKGASSVTLKAQATNANVLDNVSHNGDASWGTKTATLNGNIVQGNIPVVTLIADAYPSNGTANINGNIVQVSSNTAPPPGATVTLEATGNHISITNNKVTLGKHTFNLTINGYAAFDNTIKDNEFKGSGTNLFNFTDNALGGVHHDTVSVDLGAGTFVFNGNSNVLTGFNAVSISGNGVNATLTGGSGDDILIGGDGDDVINGGGGNDIIRGKGGNDILDGGDGNDFLYGGDGDDILMVSTGTDVLDGMTDPLGDTASFANATGPSGVTVVVGDTNPHDYSAAFNGVPTTTTLLNIQNVTGTGFADTLTGDAQNNTLTGGAGNDILRGNAGDDTLAGGADSDTAIYAGNYGTDYNVAVNASGNGTVADLRPGTPDGTDTLTSIEFIQFNNGTFNTATQTFVPFGPANTAPVLNPLATPVLAAENEDAGAPSGPVGTLVSSLVDLDTVLGGLDNVTDPDVGAQTGIALTATNTGNGSWFYSIDNGATWAAVGAVSDASALLLAADANTRLYFQPNANFNGPVTNGITFRAWDRTSGSNGGTANTTVNGGTTAFSTLTDTADISITAVNDAPVATITPPSYSATEQVALDLKNSGMSVSDVDAGAGSVTATLSVTEGTLTVTAGTSGAGVSGSGTGTVTLTGTLAQINDLLNTNGTSTVSYIDNTDAPSSSATLSLSVNDGGNTGTGGPLSGSDTATINITAVNDAPVATITPPSYSATEQVALDLKNSGMSVSDVDAGAGSVTATLSVTEGTLTVTAGTSGAGVSGSGTGTVILTGTLAQINDLLNTNGTSTVSYIDNTDTPSASATLSLSVNDGGNTGTGGPLSGSDTATINITAVNDAPTLTATGANATFTEGPGFSVGTPASLFSGAAVSTVEGGQTITGLTFTVSNVVNGLSEQINVDGSTIQLLNGTSGTTTTNALNYTVSVVANIATITLSSVGGISSAAAATLVDGISYQNTADNPTAGNRTVTLTQVMDNGGTANGGIDTTSLSIAATVNVVPVNDSPVLNSGATPVMTAETQNPGAPGVGSGTLVSSLVDLPGGGGLDNVTDPDGPGLGIALTGTNSANGTWSYSTDGGTTWNAVGAVSDAGALLLDGSARLFFQPTLNTFNGTVSNAITFRAWDESTGTNGGTANASVNGGSTAFSSSNDTADLTVTPTNNAPVLDNSKSPALSDVRQNSGAPSGAVGSLVSSLVDYATPSGQVDNVSDADGPGLGIAVTGTAGGTWYYSTDNGASWNAVGAVSDGSALLLDGSARLYLSPTTDTSGTVANGITFRAWDESSGANGGMADTTTNGGNTAFSTDTDTASILVAPVWIGSTNYATINDALAAAQDGDVIHVGPGTYNESLLVNKQVSIVGEGAPGTVIINGPFLTDQTGVNTPIAPGGVANWLKTRTQAQGGYGGDTGITVNADNVSLTNLTVQNFKYMVGTQNNAELLASQHNTVNNLTLTDVDMKSGIAGFYKEEGTTLNGLTINNGSVSDALFGVYLAQAAANGGDATDTTIQGTDFSNILQKGIYAETARGNTLVDGTTMNDVGNYGGVPTNGANGANGNAIDFNLKFDTYQTGETLDITNNQLTNVGKSGGTQYGAIVVEGRDDPNHSVYGPNTVTGHPADVTELAVNITGGFIDDTKVGVRAGEAAKGNPSLNVSGPAMTVDVPVTNYTESDYDNHTKSLMTIIGTNGVDNLDPGITPVSTGPLRLVGLGDDDFLTGGAGDDILDGGLGDDTLDGGVGGSDTADYSDAPSAVTVDLTIAGSQVTGGAGTDILTSIENLYGSNFDDVLVGDGGDFINNSGNNVLRGGAGDDVLNGNGYTTGIGDTADYGDATEDGLYVDLDAGISMGGYTGFSNSDTFIGIQNLTGSAFADYLVGDAGDNILRGGKGDDTLDGGVGFASNGDTADYSDATVNGLIADLNTGSSSGGNLGNDTLFNIQNLSGSKFKDTLIGDAGNNTLAGGDGNDIVWGHGGSNVLFGGSSDFANWFAASGTDVAYYAGREASYNPVSAAIGSTDSVTGGAEGVNDVLINIERVKFLSPTDVSDTDNDGVGNQIFQDANGNIEVRQGPAPGGAPVAIAINNANVKVIGTGQFNPDADRAADILIQDTSTGTISVITNLGGAPVTTALNLQPGVDPNPNITTWQQATFDKTSVRSDWKAIAIGYFNGDAASDVLIQNQSTGDLQMMVLNENAGEAPGTVDHVYSVTSPGANWNVIAAGDFDGNGKSDLLWQNSATKQIEVALMDGANVTNSPVAQTATNLTAVGTGDFNGDGYSDILFKNAANQAVVWFMYGDVHTGSKTISHPVAPGMSWRVSGAADVDGNGYSDIVWTDAASDSTSATLLKGPATLASATVQNPNYSLATSNNTFHLIASTGGG